MAEKINLRQPGYKARARQVQSYGTQTPLSSTAVERGSTRWLNGSTVFIEGLLDITGTTQISGRLEVSGQTTLSGATTIAGPTGITGKLTIQGETDITGKLNVTGPTTLAGTLDIEGATTLTGDMDVIGGGRITVGNVILSPNAANGGVEFASGGGIGGNGGSVVMRGSGNAGFMSLSTAIASMFGGASQIDVKGSDVTIASPLINLNAPQTSVNGNLVATGTVKVGATTELSQTRLRVGSLPTTSIATANVHVDSNGIFYRVAA